MPKTKKGTKKGNSKAPKNTDSKNFIFRPVRSEPKQYYYNSNVGNTLTLKDSIGNVLATPHVKTTGSLSSVMVGTRAFGISYDFRLANVTNYAEFTSMWDSYRIKKVHCTIDNLMGNLQDGSGPVAYIPEVTYAFDTDDNIPPPTEVTLSEMAGSKVRKLEQSKTIKFSFKPKTSQLLYDDSSVTTVAFGTPADGGWIDCTYPNVSHYGLKMFFDNILSTLGESAAIRVAFRYELEFKGIR